MFLSFQSTYIKLASLVNFIFNVSGRVPPVHRGAVAAREDVRVHLVQPAGRQEEILQEAREENVTRGGETMQGGAHGEPRYGLLFPG